MSRNHFIHALKWSMASEIASKAIQPLVFILLARLLIPEDFGIMSAALMVISFSQIFWEAGMAKALIQRQTDVEEAANVAFWVNIGLGSVVAVIIYLVASPVAHAFFQDSRVTAVLQVMTLQVFLGAVSAVHTALLQKEMDFKRLFWVRFATVSLPGLASIPLAWYGMGYWALVVGTLIGQAAQVIMLWRLSTWRPSWSFNTYVAKEMVKFSKWVAGSGVLAWFFAWADSLIVGMYLGIHDLGLYRFSKQFVSMSMEIVATAVMPVAYSKLARHQTSLDEIRRYIFLSGKGLVLILFPIGAGIYLTGDLFIPLIIGAAWAEVATFIGIMAITQAIAYSVSLNQEAIRAIGRSDVETRVMFISMAIRLLFYLVFIEYGLYVFVLASLASTIIGVVNHLVFAKSYLKLEYSKYFEMVRYAVLASLIMTGIGLGIIFPVLAALAPIFQLLILVVFSMILYLVIISKLETQFIIECIKIFNRNKNV